MFDYRPNRGEKKKTLNDFIHKEVWAKVCWISANHAKTFIMHICTMYLFSVATDTDTDTDTHTHIHNSYALYENNPYLFKTDQKALIKFHCFFLSLPQTIVITFFNWEKYRFKYGKGGWLRHKVYICIYGWMMIYNETYLGFLCLASAISFPNNFILFATIWRWWKWNFLKVKFFGHKQNK